MEVQGLVTPFSHIILKNVFDEKQYKEVFNEILHFSDKLYGPEKTGTAKDDSNSFLKKGSGVFVDKVYSRQYREMSKILTHNRVLFNEKVKNCAKQLDLLFSLYYEMTNTDVTLLQKYSNGDFYLPHKDLSLFTSVIVLHTKPKKYSGGQLYFPDYDYELDISDNEAIIFPGQIMHGVKEIKYNKNFDKHSRYSLATLIYMNVDDIQRN